MWTDIRRDADSREDPHGSYVFASFDAARKMVVMSTPKRAVAPAASFHGTPRFEVRRVIGEGGMAIVYEAFDRDRQMPVALKTLRWVDAQSIFGLKTEFRARADLEHRNLVRLGELHHDEGYWFFTMELVKGVDFLEWVRATEVTDDVPARPAA